MHAALDFSAPAGTPIKAIADGTVIGDAWDSLSGYYIALRHTDGWRSTYRHLRTDAPPTVGQAVAQGQAIGYVGSTGYSTGPHLHFDLWNTTKRDSTAFAKHGLWAHDPELYLGQEDDMALTDADRATFNKWFAENMKTAAKENGQLVNIFKRGFPHLNHAASGAVVRGHPDHQPSEVQKRVNTAVRGHAATPHGGAGGLKRGDTVELR
jgi:hypothetical protein